MNQVVEHQPTDQAANVPATIAPQQMMTLISQAASDPNVDPAKMMGLLDVQERMMNKQAQMDFDADFARLQMELPRITKDSQIKHNNKTIAHYASYEKIDEVIRPLLIKYGFGLRFNSGDSGGQMIMEGILSHRGGHSVKDMIPLKVEKVAAMNSAQSAKSAVTYGKRILAEMMLNLVFEGGDDDGRSVGFVPISDDQAAQLKDLIREKGANTVTFLERMFADVKSIDDIPQKDFNRTLMTLQAMKSRAE